MTDPTDWDIRRESDDTRTVISPGGLPLFNVSLPTLEILGRMFLDEAEDAGELEDLREVLYG